MKGPQESLELVNLCAENGRFSIKSIFKTLFLRKVLALNESLFYIPVVKKLKPLQTQWPLHLQKTPESHPQLKMKLYSLQLDMITVSNFGQLIQVKSKF